jgi:hypothetical protein
LPLFFIYTGKMGVITPAGWTRAGQLEAEAKAAAAAAAAASVGAVPNSLGQEGREQLNVAAVSEAALQLWRYCWKEKFSPTSAEWFNWFNEWCKNTGN